MKTATRRELAEMRQLCTDVVVMRDRMQRAGLWMTAAKMAKVIDQIGWETAARIQGDGPNVIYEGDADCQYQWEKDGPRRRECTKCLRTEVHQRAIPIAPLGRGH